MHGETVMQIQIITGDPCHRWLVGVHVFDRRLISLLGRQGLKWGSWAD